MKDSDKILEHKKLLDDPLYYYFSYELREIDYKIEENKRKLKDITFKQQSLKRGKHELVKLRRELKDRIQKVT